MNEGDDLSENLSWEKLSQYFDFLPSSVRLHLWGDENASSAESEAFSLAANLNQRFQKVEYQLFPRRENYHYYPVIGVMGLKDQESVDHGIRFIGLPAGYQMTSLIAAIQSVAFQGMTSEVKTRIQIPQLKAEVGLELITDTNDNVGPKMAQIIFNLSVLSPEVKSYLIMGNAFPEVFTRYSVNYVPHLVINEKYHIEGVISETELLQEIARLLKGT